MAAQPAPRQQSRLQRLRSNWTLIALLVAQLALFGLAYVFLNGSTHVLRNGVFVFYPLVLLASSRVQINITFLLVALSIVTMLWIILARGKRLRIKILAPMLVALHLFAALLTIIMAGFAWGGPHEHVASVSAEGHVYHLVLEYWLPRTCDPCYAYPVRLFECDSLGLWCHEVERADLDDYERVGLINYGGVFHTDSVELRREEGTIAVYINDVRALAYVPDSGGSS